MDPPRNILIRRHKGCRDGAGKGGRYPVVLERELAMPDFCGLKLRSSECAVAAENRALSNRLDRYCIEGPNFDAIPFQQWNFPRLSCVHFGGPLFDLIALPA
jgi:hypothetical protein